MSDTYKGTVIEELMALVESCEHSVALRKKMTRNALEAAYRAGKFDGILEAIKTPTEAARSNAEEFNRTQLELEEVSAMGPELDS